MKMAGQDWYEINMTNFNLEAKRGRGLDDLLDSLTPAKLDDFKMPTFQNGAIEQLLKLYLNYLQDESYFNYGKLKYGAEDGFYAQMQPLDASQFTSLIDKIKIFERLDHYRALFPRFVNTLIQKSYDGGHNDFVIHYSRLPPQDDTQLIAFSLQLPPKDTHLIAFSLVGKAERPLHITVKTENPYLVIGFSTELGRVTRHCRFEIHGDLISNHEVLPYANGAQFCTYVHHGALKLDENSRYRGMSEFEYPENCVFKTSNLATLEILQRKVGGGNTVYLIERDGRERKVR